MADDRHDDDIDSRLARARAVENVRVGETPEKPAKGYKQGSRVLAELIGAPLGGGLIGFALDSWFKTLPVFLLIMIGLAFVVAFRNIYRISKERAE